MNLKDKRIIIAVAAVAVVLVAVIGIAISKGVSSGSKEDSAEVKTSQVESGTDTESANSAETETETETEAVSEVEEEKYRLLKVWDLYGDIIAKRDSENLEPYEDMNLIPKDFVEIGENSDMTIKADDDKYLSALENTAFSIDTDGDANSGYISVDLIKGRMSFIIENKLGDGDVFEVQSPNALMAVRGTRFSVSYNQDTGETGIEVSEGHVLLAFEKGFLLLTEGDYAIILENGRYDSNTPLLQADENGNLYNPRDNGWNPGIDLKQVEYGFFNGKQDLQQYLEEKKERDVSDWREVYKALVDDIKPFLKSATSEYNGGRIFNYVLLDIQGDDIPELIVGTEGNSGNGRYNPFHIISINSDTNEPYVAGTRVMEVSDSFRGKDGTAGRYLLPGEIKFAIDSYVGP